MISYGFSCLTIPIETWSYYPDQAMHICPNAAWYSDQQISDIIHNKEWGGRHKIGKAYTKRRLNPQTQSANLLNTPPLSWLLTVSWRCSHTARHTSRSTITRQPKRDLGDMPCSITCNTQDTAGSKKLSALCRTIPLVVKSKMAFECRLIPFLSALCGATLIKAATYSERRWHCEKVALKMNG